MVVGGAWSGISPRSCRNAAEPDLVGDREARAGRCRSIRSSSRPSPTERRVEFRDNAAYALLLERARGKTPAELAAVARRDIVLRPSLAKSRALSRRADPSARDGPARAPLSVQAEQDRLAVRGVDHHAGATRSSRTPAYLKKPRRGCRSAPTSPSAWSSTVISSRSWKYQASDVAAGHTRTGRPDRLGTCVSRPPPGVKTRPCAGHSSLSASCSSSRSRGGPINSAGCSPLHRSRPSFRRGRPTEEIDTSTLDDWVHSMGPHRTRSTTRTRTRVDTRSVHLR